MFMLQTRLDAIFVVSMFRCFSLTLLNTLRPLGCLRSTYMFMLDRVVYLLFRVAQYSFHSFRIRKFHSSGNKTIVIMTASAQFIVKHLVK